MRSIRLMHRLLLFVFIVKAAALRQEPFSESDYDPTDFNDIKKLQQTNDVDATENNIDFMSQGGNALPKTEIIWEIKRADDARKTSNYFPTQKYSHPLLTSRWRLKHRRYDKVKQMFQVKQRWAYLNSPPASMNWNAVDENNMKNNINNYKRLMVDISKRQIWNERLSKRGTKYNKPIVKIARYDPRYPLAYLLKDIPTKTLLNAKREQMSIEEQKYLPSISAGAMTNLADFFDNLSTNMHFTEKSQLGQEEAQILEGEHPLRMLHNSADEDKNYAEKTKQLLHAIRTYRPSQQIRSLVARNPEGYRGSHQVDPSYMWLGLGKK